MRDSQSAIKESPAPRERTAAWWIKLLVLFHVFCICVWACPKPAKEFTDGTIKPRWYDVNDQIRLFADNHLKTLSVVPVYLFTTGTWQYWDMFAPEPANIDFYGDAVVTYRDGTKATWDLPRMEKLPIQIKFLKERYRKYFERAHDDKFQYLFQPLCERIAELCDKYPDNPPVRVAVYRHWIKISDPGQVQPKQYDGFNYYTGEIDLKQLRQMEKRTL